MHLLPDSYIYRMYPQHRCAGWLSDKENALHITQRKVGGGPIDSSWAKITEDQLYKQNIAKPWTKHFRPHHITMDCYFDQFRILV